MSVRVMSAVWDSDLPSDEKFVALALADWADDDGRRIYPSQGLLAWKVGKTDRAVRDTLTKLHKRGVLDKVGRHYGGAEHGGHGATVEYQINLDALPGRPAWVSPFRPEEPSGRVSHPEVDGTPPGSLRHPTRKPTSDNPSEIHQEPPELSEGAPHGAPTPLLPSQGGLWGQEQRDRLQVMKDIISERFNNRRGSQSNRDRLARLVRAGATVQQLQAAIDVAKQSTRDDPLAYSIAVLARMLEEGDDGSSEAAGGGRGGAVRGAAAGTRPGGFTGGAGRDGDHRGAATAGAPGQTRYGDLW
ncbi:MAG: hypothetical protein M0R75_14660 [Dehalococcoidia bacterium]|nr:hypothetical protein [Dehalococcoidia bacterium]